MIEIQMIGNLGQDATIKEWNGRRYIAFNLGDSERYTDKDGTVHERAQWVSCLKPVKNDNTSLATYLLKGTQVFIRGHVSTRCYSNKDGIWQAGLNCTVHDLQLLSSKRAEAGNSGMSEFPTAQPQQPYTATPIPQPDDELPY